jgi:hypothetical protein
MDYLDERDNRRSAQDHLDDGLQNVDDILDVIQYQTHDEDFISYLDWHKRLENGDALFNIVQILVKNRKDPRYIDLVQHLRDEIEGWL